MADRSELTTLQLNGFDHHGTARARYQGRWIEVEQGIPGETVKVELSGKRRLRAHIREILTPAVDRVEPPCVYFRDWQCGGCQWQHIAYERQVAQKCESVNAAMQREGLTITISASHTPSNPWRYRSTAGISLGKRAGFRRHGSLAIVPIRDCLISHPLIGSLMAILNDHLESGTLPDFRGRVRLDVCLDMSDGKDRLQVVVRPSATSSLQDFDQVDSLMSSLAKLDLVSGLCILQPDGTIKTVSGPRFATIVIGNRPVFLSAASFFQTNLALLPRLVERLQQEARPLAAMRVADVYGGVGIFGLFLAQEAKSVDVIEADPMAVEAGRLNAARWDLTNVQFTLGTAEDLLLEAASYDVVIVDPPRSGLAPPVIEALVEGRPGLILYVSCLAQSLARDLRPLESAGYRVEHLELFDFYPQTYHVELLAVLRSARL